MAMPKSSSLTTRLGALLSPFDVDAATMKMLLALRSRWTMPCSCATCSAEQTGCPAKSQVTLTAYNNATKRQNLFNQTNLTYSLGTGNLHQTLLMGAEVAGRGQ